MEHENCVGESSEWYTPPEMFTALGCEFDLDPCSPPGGGGYVPAREKICLPDDGLAAGWGGQFAWMNPPFGGRNGHVPWLRKFFKNGNGIGLARAYTSAGWFHDWMPRADVLVFPRGKTKFVRQDGTIGRAPGAGIVLFGCGAQALQVLSTCRLGMCVMQIDKGVAG